VQFQAFPVLLLDVFDHAEAAQIGSATNRASCYQDKGPEIRVCDRFVTILVG
jgi:hypothetical protein